MGEIKLALIFKDKVFYMWLNVLIFRGSYKDKLCRFMLYFNLNQSIALLEYSK